MPQFPNHQRNWLLFVAKVGIFALVAWFIFRAVQKARHDVTAQDFSFAELNWPWLAFASGLFLVGSLPMAWFWHRAMWQLGQQPALHRSIAAYFLGGLGKYVPGKAMVVVLRVAFIRGPRVSGTVAGLCVFIETLTMMAVGGFLAAAVLLAMSLTQEIPPLLTLLAMGLMAATGIPTFPPLFRRIVVFLKVKQLDGEVEELLERLDYRLMAQGWLANLLSWTVWGVSLWAVLMAMPVAREAMTSLPAELPRLVASVSLAVVAGFLSLLPGGMGAREWILGELLAPRFGPMVAIVSVVLLRLTWLVAEVIVSGILYVCGRFWIPAGSGPIPADRPTIKPE